MNGLKDILYDLKTSSGSEQLRFVVFLCLIFSLPFDIIYSSVLFITFLLCVLVDLRFEKFKAIPKQVWIFESLYFLAAVGYFYSLHRHEAAFMLERQLSMLLLPLFIPLAFKVNQTRVNAALQTITLASILALVYLFAFLIQVIHFELKLPLLSTLFSGAFFNHEFSRPLKIHAGYLSLYVSISVIYLIYVFNLSKSVKWRLLYSLCIGFLFIGLFFLASRNILIATLVILLFLYPMFGTKKKSKYLVYALLGLFVSFVVVRSVPYLWDRFSSEMVSDMKSIQQSGSATYYTAEPRVDRWLGGLSLAKRSPLIGYGTGDEKEMLKTEYMRRQLYISYLESFNAHNQYLSYLLKNGLLGLLVFFAAFYYYFKLAIKRNDFMYAAFLMLLMMGFYTENILDANKGIFFFSVFNTLMGYNAIAAEEEEEKLEQLQTGS